VISITNSARSSFLDCQKKYFWEYVRRWSPLKEPYYFLWGRFIHELLGTLYTFGDLQGLAKAFQGIETQREVLLKTGLYTPEEIEATCVTAKGCLSGYFLRWREADKQYEGLDVERVFTLPLSEDVVFKGRLDRAVRDLSDGAIVLQEHKTAAALSPGYWDSLVFDTQNKGYLLGLQHAIGHADCRKVIYDVLVKPNFKRKVGESLYALAERTADAYIRDRNMLFVRKPIEYRTEQIENYRYELEQLAETLRWHYQEGIWLPHHTKLTRCAFSPLCAEGEDSWARRRFRIRAEIHPELVGVGE